VAAASLLGALPIVTTTGWFPDFGFLMLIAWRLLRSDVWPAWWAAPLGLLNDLVIGHPIGFSIALWTAAMLLLDLIDRRTMWRDYWIEWALAGVLLLAYETAEWRVAQMMGASLPFASIVPPLVISVLAFPIAAWAAVRLDRWRLGR
jgi:rod shape-determining protein MreD